jgi:hypothetical protein
VVFRASKGTHHGITLLNSIHDFVVAADMMDSFQEAEFKKSVKPGDHIILTVPKTLVESSKPERNIWIFGIKDKNQVYLNPDTAFKEYKSSHIFIVLWILFLGSVLFFGRSAYLYSTAP